MTSYRIKKNLQIAIDGPVASGKGTVASILSRKLKILYVNTGAMYRAVAYLARSHGLDYLNESAILSLLKKTTITLKQTNKKNHFCSVFLDGSDISEEILTPEMSQGSSAVAVLPSIRQELVKRQKKITAGQSVVMEGRDIITRVLPEADLKIFMTADIDERARRRYLQLRERGIKENISQVITETKERDYQDTHRKADPLKLTKGALVLDTTKLTIEQAVEQILIKLKERQLIFETEKSD